MKKIIKTYVAIAFIMIFGLSNTFAQTYFGAGNETGITVTSSSSQEGSEASNTLNGGGMDAELMEISRFLSQTTFGATIEEIEEVNALGMEAWIDQQLSLPVNELTPVMWNNWDIIRTNHNQNFDKYLANYIQELCGAYYDDDTGTVEEPTPLTAEEVEEMRIEYEENIFGPATFEVNTAWSQHIFTTPDKLRQRMAYALSQIMVISSQSDLGDHAETVTAFYDLLQKNAFGNYKDLLLDVTLSPAMGFYLSHLNNPKADTTQNIHPDENYAREIMQLFSIGLYELNLDGSRKKDNDGNDIPTYNNGDIKELARVFTGLGPGTLDPTMDIDWTDEAYFGLDLYAMNKTEPLVMYQDWHDTGSKSALNGLEIPAEMEGMAEIEMVVDFLYNHDNVGPFISRQLIQRMITSNPSQAYIQRVSTVFNNNGSGVRGDLGAVLKAIIMDEEARSCAAIMDPLHGKLNEPYLRATRSQMSFPRVGYRYEDRITFTDYSCSGMDTIRVAEELVYDDLKIWDNGYGIFEDIKQYPMMSPTVFNFYLPDHQPVGEIQELGLVAPEFKIHDSSTAINFMNHAWMMANPWYNIYWYNWLEDSGIETIMPDYTELAEIYEDEPEKLINHLDIVLTNGKLSDSTRDAIRQLVKDMPEWTESINRTRTVIYLFLISPDYNIDK